MAQNAKRKVRILKMLVPQVFNGLTHSQLVHHITKFQACGHHCHQFLQFSETMNLS
jgi:hypothetical protein